MVSIKIITEEMKYRKQMCDYALKNGITKTARRYHTNRKFIYRQLEKYDGTVKSLALKSRKPHFHPNQHTREEIDLINKVKSRYYNDGLAEVYIQLNKRKSYTNHKEIKGNFPGDKVQIDIKYVPLECLTFDTQGKKNYQITAIDEYSRKRILEIVDEKSVTNRTIFIKTLENKIGFKIKTIQTDNGSEFVNNQENTKNPTIFEITLKGLGIKHKRTRPYSPWQNGKVERSHKIDSERFYGKKTFNSVNDLKLKIKRYNARHNNIARKVLNFKSPNQIIKEYKINYTLA